MRLRYLLIAVTVGIVALFVVVTPFPSPGRGGADSTGSPSQDTSAGTSISGLLLPTLRRLSRHAGWREGALAQFLYVGAQIGVWSFLIRYVRLSSASLSLSLSLSPSLSLAAPPPLQPCVCLYVQVQRNLPGTSEQAAADYLFASLVCMVLGRFLSVALLRWVDGGGRGRPRVSGLTGVRLMEA